MRLPTTWAKFVLACGLALGLASLAWTEQENQTKGAKSVTVTGCLQKAMKRESTPSRVKMESAMASTARASISPSISDTRSPEQVRRCAKRTTKRRKMRPEGVNMPISGSRISSISVKPASKQPKGAGSIKLVRLLSLVSAFLIAPYLPCIPRQRVALEDASGKVVDEILQPRHRLDTFGTIKCQ